MFGSLLAISVPLLGLVWAVRRPRQAQRALEALEDRAADLQTALAPIARGAVERLADTVWVVRVDDALEALDDVRAADRLVGLPVRTVVACPARSELAVELGDGGTAYLVHAGGRLVPA